MLAILGCHPASPAANPVGSGAVVVEPEALLARARAEAPPSPQLGNFSIRLSTPKEEIAAQGSLVVAAPDRFRLELRGPIGPPAFLVACDGHRLTAWATGKGQAWRHEDADAGLRALTGGSAGLAAVTSLLLGRLPAEGNPSWTGEAYRWEGPKGEVITAQLEARSAHLAFLDAVDAAGAPMFRARWEPDLLPERLQLSLPTIGVSADLRFSGWEAVQPPDSAFALQLPESVVPAPFPGS